MFEEREMGTLGGLERTKLSHKRQIYIFFINSPNVSEHQESSFMTHFHLEVCTPDAFYHSRRFKFVSRKVTLIKTSFVIERRGLTVALSPRGAEVFVQFECSGRPG